MNIKTIHIISSINDLKNIKSYKNLNITYIDAKGNKSILSALKKAKRDRDRKSVV